MSFVIYELQNNLILDNGSKNSMPVSGLLKKREYRLKCVAWVNWMRSVVIIIGKVSKNVFLDSNWRRNSAL